MNSDIGVIREAIKDTFGNDDRKYYVYALCEKKDDGSVVPFYIGKGEGCRVFDHENENDAKALLKKIKTEYSEIDEDKEKEFSNKHKEIAKLISEERYERRIIKWGLTSDEAFMVESALINFVGFDNLTNIVNGHASEKERNSNIGKTVAMTVEEFYDSCCKKPIRFEYIKEKWLFININDSYKKIDCNDPKQICDAARGYWSLACNPQDYSEDDPAYLFALYEKKIMGIFRLKERIRVSKITEETKHYLRKYPEENFKSDHKNMQDPNHNIQSKSLFVCEELDPNQILFESITVGDLLNRLIITKDNKSIFPPRGSSTRYPSVKIHNEARVNAAALKKALLKYFLHVEIKNGEKNSDKDEEFYKLLDYTVKEKEDPEVLAKEIYDEIALNHRAELINNLN